jgi:hypothetical protein
VDQTDWFLGLITFLLAVIALETVSDATSNLFRDISAGISILVLLGVPLYLLARIILDRTSD